MASFLPAIVSATDRCFMQLRWPREVSSFYSLEQYQKVYLADDIAT